MAPFCSLFPRISQRPLMAEIRAIGAAVTQNWAKRGRKKGKCYSRFVDMVHVQRNRFPTAVFQNSTYQTYLKTSEKRTFPLTFARVAVRAYFGRQNKRARTPETDICVPQDQFRITVNSLSTLPSAREFEPDGFATGGSKLVFTFCFKASGAVHLMGSLPPSREKFSSRARPKSDTLAELSSVTRTFRAARSLCTTCRDSRYAMPAHVSLQENGNRNV